MFNEENEEAIILLKNIFEHNTRKNMMNAITFFNIALAAKLDYVIVMARFRECCIKNNDGQKEIDCNNFIKIMV